jgi:hypothetical protein
MKTEPRRLVLIILIAMVVVPLAVAIVWPATLMTGEDISVTGLLLVVLAGPFLVPLYTKLRTHFCRMCILWLIFGVWQLCWAWPMVDLQLPRDVPRSVDLISLLMAILAYSGISTLLLSLRKSAVRQRKARLDSHP